MPSVQQLQETHVAGDEGLAAAVIMNHSPWSASEHQKEFGMHDDPLLLDYKVDTSQVIIPYHIDNVPPPQAYVSPERFNIELDIEMALLERPTPATMPPPSIVPR